MAGSIGAGLQQGSEALQQACAINNQARGGVVAGAIQKAKAMSSQASISLA